MFFMLKDAGLAPDLLSYAAALQCMGRLDRDASAIQRWVACWGQSDVSGPGRVAGTPCRTQWPPVAEIHRVVGGGPVSQGPTGHHVFPQMSEADGPRRAAASGALHKPVAVQGGPGRTAARPAQGRAHLQRPTAAPARVPAQQLAPAQGDLRQGEPQPPAWHLQAGSCAGLEPGPSDPRAVPRSPSPLLPLAGPPVSQSHGACCPDVEPARLGKRLAPSRALRPEVRARRCQEEEGAATGAPGTTTPGSLSHWETQLRVEHRRAAGQCSGRARTRSLPAGEGVGHS